MDPVQPNNSLINGLACLQFVVTREEPIGVRELARELNLTPTRVSRLLTTLAHLGLVSRTSRRKYRPGPAIHVLAAHSLHASPLLTFALPHLLNFRKEGFTVALGVLWRRQICYLFHERPSQSLEEAIGRHEVYPAEYSSAGMVLLADAKAPEPLEPPKLDRTVEYLNSPAGWNDRLRLIRERGFAALRYENGEVSIGVPIENPAVAAIAISGRDLADARIAELADRLRAAAVDIEKALSLAQR